MVYCQKQSINGELIETPSSTNYMLCAQCNFKLPPSKDQDEKIEQRIDIRFIDGPKPQSNFFSDLSPLGYLFICIRNDDHSHCNEI